MDDDTRTRGRTLARTVMGVLLLALWLIGVRWDFPGLRTFAQHVVRADPGAADAYAASIMGGLLVGSLLMLVSRHASPAYRAQVWGMVVGTTLLAAATLMARAGDLHAPWYGVLLACAPVLVTAYALHLLVAPRHRLVAAADPVAVTEPAEPAAPTPVERVSSEPEPRTGDRSIPAPRTAAGGPLLEQAKAHALEYRGRHHRLPTKPELASLSGISPRTCERALYQLRAERTVQAV